jgi:hypothetical protein
MLSLSLFFYELQEADGKEMSAMSQAVAERGKAKLGSRDWGISAKTPHHETA